MLSQSCWFRSRRCHFLLGFRARNGPLAFHYRLHGLAEDVHSGGDFFLGDDQRGHEAEGVDSAGDDQEAALTGRGDEGCGVAGELQAED